MILKKGYNHHPHNLDNSGPIINFILRQQLEYNKVFTWTTSVVFIRNLSDINLIPLLETTPMITTDTEIQR